MVRYALVLVSDLAAGRLPLIPTPTLPGQPMLPRLPSLPQPPPLPSPHPPCRWCLPPQATKQTASARPTSWPPTATQRNPQGHPAGQK